MDPVEALNEIAYWLERDLQSPYKTKAFRAAARVAAGMPDLEKRVTDGTLKGTKGIGDSTLAVITQAVEGRVPDRLAEVRARLDKPIATSGLRAKLKGDLHAHSDWSDGTTPIDVMVSTARWLGHEYLALTDHSPHLTVANGLTAERLGEQLEIVEGFNRGGAGSAGGTGSDSSFRLLGGIEVDILDDGSLDQSENMLAQLDIVVASVHSKLRMPSSEMTERMLGAIRHPQTNVLGHCTGRLVEGSRGTRPQSQFDARAVFAACAEHDVAVELNSRPERQDPPDDLVQLALDAGCLFSIDSDAHAPGQLGLIDLGAARAEAAGIPADRIVTTWALDKLLDWAN